MTDPNIPPTGAPAYAADASYVDWPAILAGAAVASAIAFVFTTFGAALGLTMLSPYDGDGSAVAALIAVGSWMLWTTISSFFVGGYIAGRMRRRVDAATEDEVSVRDGIHGLTVWAVGLLLGVLLLAAGSDTAVMATADAMGAATSAGAEVEMTAAEAEALAETARITSVISAFVVGAALFVAAAAAYWAAGIGGTHRDEGRVFARFGRWT